MDRASPRSSVVPWSVSTSITGAGLPNSSELACEKDVMNDKTMISIKSFFIPTRSSSLGLAYNILCFDCLQNGGFGAMGKFLSHARNDLGERVPRQN